LTLNDETEKKMMEKNLSQLVNPMTRYKIGITPRKEKWKKKIERPIPNKSNVKGRNWKENQF
jgi:hypothetical protein